MTHEINERNLQQFIADSNERLKELACLNQTTKILKEGLTMPETLQKVCNILPNAWQYPEYTVARIQFSGIVVTSKNFQISDWKQIQDFETFDKKRGTVEVFYTKHFRDIDEGPFLKEERELISNLSSMISGYLSSLRGVNFLNRQNLSSYEKSKSEDTEATTYSKSLLQKYLNKQNVNRDIYHDLMNFKVKEILLVANLYDAYSIEKEGHISDHLLGDYHQLNLSSIPRITGVSSADEAIIELNNKHFDLVIIMKGVDDKMPIEVSEAVKAEFPYIPVYLLLNNNKDITLIEDDESITTIDRIFVWNGDSKVFFAMVKNLEDKVNVENDTRIGLVRVILLVEDSAKYYSRYLPLLYTSIMEQTQRIIKDVGSDEQHKLLRMRARSKILLASTYEEAVSIFNKYRDYILCLISDVKFKKQGKLHSEAGFDLVRHIKRELPELPTIVQSSDIENQSKAYETKAFFIDKNSDSLLQDIKSFIRHHLGFGNFIYKDSRGREIGIAKSLREFENNLSKIPDESLLYHARKNHFSLWLMARGEIKIAKIIQPAQISDFEAPSELRNYLLKTIQEYRTETNRGKIIPFEESSVLDETNVTSLSEGSLGGKGRGLAFINNLLYNFDFTKFVPGINIRAPRTLVVGTDEFEFFLERNNLYQKVLNNKSFEFIKESFLNADLSDGLVKKLKKVIRLIKKPIAVRSSGLFEDSLMQPFAGIFETYLIPNNHPDFEIRLKQAMDSIKLVYASVFSKTARGYVEAINYKIEEEKMAVILQEVVGNQYGDTFYPHISGVAQSYNYYPFGHIEPEDGFAVMAVGLGKYVVEGEKCYRFSPKYPTTQNMSPKDLFKNSQTEFFAVDMKKKDINLLEGDTAGLTRLDIYDAEKHGTLRHSASVYSSDNNSMEPGLDSPGPRIINFANILKYNYVPLAKTIEVVLDVVKEALGSPCEIEFAVDLNKDRNYKASFYLLQIKPLIGNALDYSINLESIDPEKVLLRSEKGMGNGKISSLYDVIYIDKNKFDKTKTREMAQEIDELNQKMFQQNKEYVLIGPGRWGTRDRWIGIPVNWPQISKAKVIVETSLEDFPLDASSGSHFFHNVTSMNVGYFSIQHTNSETCICWDVLEKQTLVEEKQFFKHVRFEKPLTVSMDGKKRISVITFDE